MTLTVGSLFSGAAGLDRAVESVLDARTAWHAEIDPAACKVLAHRYPDVPNLGDVSGIDWATVPPVDVICGGSPCQDVSHAGKRAGMRAGTRSGLWAAMCDAIDIIRPSLVVWENVRGVLSAEADSAVEPCAGCVGDADDGAVLRALGRVVGDLASLGYDARWHGLRAADVGAPHGRFRVFVTAWPAADASSRPLARAAAARDGLLVLAERGHGVTPDALSGGRDGRTHQPQRRPEGRTATAGNRAHAATDAASDGRDEGRPESARIVGRSDAAERGAVASDAPRAERRGAQPEHLRARPLAAAEPRECIGETAGNAAGLGAGTGILGRAQDLLSSGLLHSPSCSGMVQEALRSVAHDGESRGDETERADSAQRGGTILGDGQQDADMLALDGGVREPLRAWQVYGRAEEHEGSPLGLRVSDRADSTGSDTGSSLPGTGVRESRASRAGDAIGECAAGECGKADVPAGPSPERPEPVPESAGDSSVPSVQERGEPTAPAIDWGQYAPAIERWAAVLGRPAPAPTELAPRGGQRLSPRFVEWMLGWPDGWVTDVPGVSRNDALKICGNGVVPQQVGEALRRMLTAEAVAA